MKFYKKFIFILVTALTNAQASYIVTTDLKNKIDHVHLICEDLIYSGAFCFKGNLLSFGVTHKNTTSYWSALYVDHNKYDPIIQVMKIIHYNELLDEVLNDN